MRRAPAKPCECVALLPSKNMTRVRPACDHEAMERQAKTSSHFTVPSSHPALHKPHFISAQATLQQLLSQSKLLHTEAFTYTKLLQRKESYYTDQFLHTEQFWQKPLQREAFRHRGCYTKNLLHGNAFKHSKL